MFLRTLCAAVLVSALVVQAVAQDEVVGSDGDLFVERVDPLPETAGFHGGSSVMNLGLMYASSLIGADFEFGLSRLLGFQIGAGLFGAAAGLNFHLASSSKSDHYISAAADYMPGLEMVMPDLSYNWRRFFGKSARAGICLKIGMGICTVDKTVTVGSTTVRYEPGKPMLTYAVGVPIRLN